MSVLRKCLRANEEGASHRREHSASAQYTRRVPQFNQQLQLQPDMCRSQQTHRESAFALKSFDVTGQGIGRVWEGPKAREETNAVGECEYGTDGSPWRAWTDATRAPRAPCVLSHLRMIRAVDCSRELSTAAGRSGGRVSRPPLALHNSLHPSLERTRRSALAPKDHARPPGRRGPPWSDTDGAAAMPPNSPLTPRTRQRRIQNGRQRFEELKKARIARMRDAAAEEADMLSLIAATPAVKTTQK